MQTLSQWGALEALAGDPDDAYAALLNVPATWWVDRDGTAHGKPEHALAADGQPVPATTGTLRELCHVPRHAKTCLSVARAGGADAVAAATMAQHLTEGLHGYDQLVNTPDDQPGTAIALSGMLLRRLPEPADPGLARIVDRVRQDILQRCDQAFAAARSAVVRQRIIDECIDLASVALPDSPVARLRRLLNEQLHGWGLIGALTKTPVDQAWVDNVQQHITTITPTSTKLLDALTREQIQDALAVSTSGASVREALESTWRATLCDIAGQAPDWIADYRASSTVTRDRLAVAIAAPEQWQAVNADVHAAWATHPDAGVLEVPLPVAEALAVLSSSVRYAPVERPLTRQELETAATLARDCGWQVSDVRELLATAIALSQ